MLTAFIRAFRTPYLRKKLLFTLGIIALFRFGSSLPAPGIIEKNVSYCANVASKSGLASTLQIVDLLNLPFAPGSSGFSSVFTGFYPVILVSWLGAMIWLEILVMRARALPGIFFVEQPPTYAEAFAVQRFQSSLSAFTLIWNYLAVVSVLFWVLFYLL